MNRMVYVSYYYSKGTEQGWGGATINTGNVVTSEDVDRLATTIKEMINADKVLVINFRRLESPE